MIIDRLEPEGGQEALGASASERNVQRGSVVFHAHKKRRIYDGEGGGAEEATGEEGGVSIRKK